MYFYQILVFALFCLQTLATEHQGESSRNGLIGLGGSKYQGGPEEQGGQGQQGQTQHHGGQGQSGSGVSNNGGQGEGQAAGTTRCSSRRTSAAVATAASQQATAVPQQPAPLSNSLGLGGVDTNSAVSTVFGTGQQTATQRASQQRASTANPATAAQNTRASSASQPRGSSAAVAATASTFVSTITVGVNGNGGAAGEASARPKGQSETSAAAQQQQSGAAGNGGGGLVMTGVPAAQPQGTTFSFVTSGAGQLPAVSTAGGKSSTVFTPTGTQTTSASVVMQTTNAAPGLEASKKGWMLGAVALGAVFAL